MFKSIVVLALLLAMTTAQLIDPVRASCSMEKKKWKTGEEKKKEKKKGKKRNSVLFGLFLRNPGSFLGKRDEEIMNIL